MTNVKFIKHLAVICAIVVLLPTLFGCQSRKKFDSSEAMIAEITGTYSGADEHGGERVVINENNVIKLNIDALFPEITDDAFFQEHFSAEDWETFNIEALLNKAYVEITTAPTSVNIKNSTISGLWVRNDGVLFSQQKEGYPLYKTTSDSIYPTKEMEERFEVYRQNLQAYEVSSIITESANNLSQMKDALESALASATGSNSSGAKSLASAETIANCAFSSIKSHLKYPRTATMDGYSRNPQYDSYGRVSTLITVTCQNGFGNYITEDIYVVLQSCSASGYYTCKADGSHYTKNEDYFSFLLIVNDWNEDPDTDSTKEASYKEAVQLVKSKNYASAVSKLDTLGDYKSSLKLKAACINLITAEQYNNAIHLFSEKKYSDASKQLTDLLKGNIIGYLRAKRVITLCKATINNSSSNENTSQPSVTGPLTTEPSVTEPLTTEPAETEPLATEQSVTEPPATKPSVTEPLTTEPAETEPLATEPSVTEPPATKPPATKPTETEPSVTEPPATKPTETEPPVTEPPETEPPETEPPAVCAHDYAKATCTEPQTCTKCNATSGSAAGHKWTDITKTIQHEEQGHYEDVEEAKKENKYRCPRCGYNEPTYATKDAYYSHFDSTHGTELNSEFDRDRYEVVEEWVYETVKEWVVDEEAYTETVVTGRKCDTCGEEE